MPTQNKKHYTPSEIQQFLSTGSMPSDLVYHEINGIAAIAYIREYNSGTLAEHQIIQFLRKDQQTGAWSFLAVFPVFDGTVEQIQIGNRGDSFLYVKALTENHNREVIVSPLVFPPSTMGLQLPKVLNHVTYAQKVEMVEDSMDGFPPVIAVMLDADKFAVYVDTALIAGEDGSLNYWQARQYVKEKYTEKRRLYLETEISKCQDIIARDRGRINELQHELFILERNRCDQLKG